MNTTTLITVAALLFGGSGVLSFWWNRRKRASRAQLSEAAVSAIAVKEELDKSREALLEGDAVSVRAVARLETELSDRRRELKAMRGAHGNKNSDIQELLDALEV